MDFIDVLKQFSMRAEKLKDQIATEEATKTSLIMPFFQQVLGYDVFNPDEFVPEFTADVGIKKGEKVDYAIYLDGSLAILVEAKWCGAPLEKHDSQLFRYFGTTNAKFAILTNGIIYRFYTDLEEQNKMDLKPFLEVDILNIKDTQVSALKSFCKQSFNVDEIYGSASELKYSNEIKQYFSAQLKDPDEEFVRFILSKVYEGMKTQSVIERFKPLIKETLNNYINELMNERITSALKKEEPKASAIGQPPEQTEPLDDPKNRIVTTEQEIEAYYIIKALLADVVDIAKLDYNDTINYFAVIYDNKVTQWICRLKLDRTKNFLILPAENKQEIKFEISGVNDLFKYKSEITDVVKRYI